MKIPVNSDIIKSLTPCEDILVNYVKHYNELNFDILEFLHLDKISAEDKVWISVRLMPVNLVEAFVMDCASRASTYAAKSVLKSYATYAAQAAADTASYTASYASYAAYAAQAASYAARTASHAAYDASYAIHKASYAAKAAADLAYAEERELQLKSIAQLIEGNK